RYVRCGLWLRCGVRTEGRVRPSGQRTILVATHRRIIPLLSRREEFFCPPLAERGCTEERRAGRRLCFHVSSNSYQSDDDPFLRRGVRGTWIRRRRDRLRRRGAAGFGGVPRFGVVVAVIERGCQPFPGKVERRAFPLGQPHFRHDPRRIRTAGAGQFIAMSFLKSSSSRWQGLLP